MKKYLPIFAVAGVLFFALVGFFIGQSGLIKGNSLVNTSSKNKVSSDILLLTQPVNNFSGKVDKIEGNAIWVSQQFTLPQPMLPPPAVTTPGQPPPAIPTPLPPKTVTYKVVINTTTQINRPPVFISYLLTTPTPPAPEKLSVKDIKLGQYISLNTNTDLRTLVNNEIVASSIQLPPIANSINGKISNISGNTLSIKAFPPSQGGPGGPAMMPNASIAPPKEVTYTVAVTDSTEISRYGQPEPAKEGAMPKGPVPEKLSVSDLKVDMQLTVWTNVDVTAVQKFTAQRIEPTIIITPPPVPTVPQAEATSVPTPTVIPSPTVSDESILPTKSSVASPAATGNNTTNLVPQKVRLTQ